MVSHVIDLHQMKGQLKTTGKPWNFKNRAAHKRTLSIFKNMHTRCSNPRAINWKYYGGAGIFVCKEWRSFDTFLADMGDAPEGHELDRIDPHGLYCKDNCRWVTHEIQNSTQRDRRRFLSREEEHCIRSEAQRKAYADGNASLSPNFIGFWKGKKRTGLRGKLVLDTH